MDGSGEFHTFNRIVLPIMKPAIAVQMIFSFVQSWNNYFIPALLLDKAEMKTVPIMIAQLRSADYSKFDMGKVYMFILLAILPVLIVYIILSKSIIKGVTAGSVKGCAASIPFAQKTSCCSSDCPATGGFFQSISENVYVVLCTLCKAFLEKSSFCSHYFS